MLKAGMTKAAILMWVGDTVYKKVKAIRHAP